MSKGKTKNDGNYKYVFFAHNGRGPYECYFCDDDVAFNDVNVHHVDHDGKNNDPLNLVPVHGRCHHQYHMRLVEYTPERRKRVREAAQKRFVDPVFLEKHREMCKSIVRREKIREAQKVITSTPEGREARSQAAKARWAKPGARERFAARKRDEAGRLV